MPEVSPSVVWFLVGLALILTEFAVPGVVLVFFGGAAWIVALLIWVGLLGELSIQLAVFGICSVLLLIGLRRWVTSWFVGKSSDGADVDEEFVGKEVRVLAPMSKGVPGKIELKGAPWQARSDDELNENDLAMVSRRDGLILTVKKIN